VVVARSEFFFFFFFLLLLLLTTMMMMMMIMMMMMLLLFSFGTYRYHITSLPQQEKFSCLIANRLMIHRFGDFSFKFF